MLKLQSKKGLNLGKRGLGSSTTRPVTTFDSKYKGKGVYVKPTTKEKRKLQELKIERLKQLNNIMRMRVHDPTDHKNGDPNKVWGYKTIENVFYGKVNAFQKNTKEKLCH